jgi:tetratricopeptide (TPR) repeat protein
MRAWWTIVACVLVASTAYAQTETDERARTHFEAGRQHFEDGSYERALEEFNRAYELSPRPVMLFNIGATQERLAMLDEAAATLERYVREVPEAPNRSQVERRIDNLRRRIAARAAGEADPGEDAGSPAARRTVQGDPTLTMAGAVVLGVAGAALVSFAIAGGIALSEDSAIQSGCFAAGDCTEQDVSGLRAASLAADVSWPIAAAAGIAGAVILALGATATHTESSARVVPFVSPTAVGVSIEGVL